MRPVSDQWQSAVTSSHTALTRVVLLDGVAETELEQVALDGGVQLSFNAANRGALTCRVLDPDLIPTDDPTDLLAPYGNELQVLFGIDYGGEAVEWTSVGIFGIEENEIVADADDYSVRLTCIDRSKIIERARYLETTTVASGTNVVTAIKAQVEPVLPGVAWNVIETEVTLPALIAQPGDDRWGFCRGLAKAVGCDLYFDGDGILTMTPIAATDPVYEIADGEDGVMTNVTKQQSREGVFNWCHASGENTGEDTVSAVALDDDPLSPTYVYGKFGINPFRYTSRYIATAAQAETAATGALVTKRGLTGSVSLGLVPNPALEPGDVVRVRRELDNGTQLIDDEQVLDGISLSLDPAQPMTATTRSVKQVQVSE